MKKLIKTLLLLPVLWFTTHTIISVSDGLVDERTKSDAGVILGNKVNIDGTLSKRLKKRLDKGIQMFNDSTFKLIIVSGGLGKEGHYEGTKMSEYLIENGIPKSKIIIDNQGFTTQDTADNVREMNLNISSVTVISQYHHIARAKLAFKNNGFENVYGGHADYFELRDLYSIVREFFGYYKYLIHGF